jgi:hypothetical protein
MTIPTHDPEIEQEAERMYEEIRQFLYLPLCDDRPCKPILSLLRDLATLRRKAAAPVDDERELEELHELWLTNVMSLLSSFSPDAIVDCSPAETTEETIGNIVGKVGELIREKMAAPLSDGNPTLSTAVAQKWNDLEWRSWAELHSPAEYVEVKLRVELSTERKMHNAWRKRATEAEARLAVPLSDARLREIEERAAKADETCPDCDGTGCTREETGRYLPTGEAECEEVPCGTCWDKLPQIMARLAHSRDDIPYLLAALRSRGGEGAQKP